LPKAEKWEGIYFPNSIDFKMKRKIAALWLSSVMLFSFVVIIVEIAPLVKAKTFIAVHIMKVLEYMIL